MSANSVDNATEILKCLIEKEIVTPVEFAAALNNAFFHGDILTTTGWYNLGDKGENLKELFEGIEKFMSAMKKIEGE